MRASVAAAALLLAAMLAFSSYRYGMFFDVDFYKWEWLMIAAALITIVPAARLRGVPIGDKEDSSARSGIAPGKSRLIFTGAGQDGSLSLPWTACAPLVISMLYALNLTLEPASVLNTAGQAIRWAAYSAYLVIGFAWFGRPAHRHVLAAALWTSGAFLIGGALAGWAGWIQFPAMIMRTSDSSLSAVGARLAGFVQYPNFLGAAAGAFLVWTWLMAVRVRPLPLFAGATALAAPAAVALLLTESRAAWMTAAAAWAGGLLLLAGAERMKWLAYSGWTLAAAGVAYRLAVASEGEKMSASSSVKLIVVLLAAAGGFLALRAALARREVKRTGTNPLVQPNGKRLGIAVWSGWVAALAVTAALLPAVVHGRWSGHFQTAGARLMYYKDGLRLFLEAPLLGRGGGAWRMLFTQIQTYPYIGNEVHSGYLDILLNLGIIGLLALAAVLGALLRGVWKNDRAGVLPPAVLMVHAAVDFDMSFGYYWLLLFAWIVYYSAPAAHAAIQDGDKPAGCTMGGGGELVFAAPPSRRFAPALKTGFALAAVAVFAAAAVYGWRFDRAARYRAAAAAASGADQAAALQRALDANPYWTRIRIELAQLAPPRRGAALLAAGLRYERQSVPLLSALGRQYARLGDTSLAADYFRLALRCDHYDRDNQTGAIVTMSRLARSLSARGDTAGARRAADTAVAFYDAFAAQGTAARAGGRAFEVTPESLSAADDSKRLLSELDRAFADGPHPPGGQHRPLADARRAPGGSSSGHAGG